MRTATLLAAAGIALAGCGIPRLPDMGNLVGRGFGIERLSIAPLQERNLCEALGGEAVQPELIITHAPRGGVPLTVRMYDRHPDGTVTEHNTVTLTSEEDGTTVADSGFLPPCNRTEGARDSSYRFDVTARGDTTTLVWGGYDASEGAITP